jgi:hypothetical protein
VIGAELSFKSINGVAKGSSHHSSVGDDYVEGFFLRQQSVGTGSHALQVGEIKFHQFETSAIGRSVFLYLHGCSFGLFQIPRRAHYLSAMSCQRACRFYPEPRRNTGHENPFALQIYAG